MNTLDKELMLSRMHALGFGFDAIKIDNDGSIKQITHDEAREAYKLCVKQTVSNISNNIKELE